MDRVIADRARAFLTMTDIGRRMHARTKRNPETECWTWQGALRRGYGRVRHSGREYPTHVLAYSFIVGDVPEGRELDHTCRNRACWNPDHLEVVTSRENTLRGEGPTAAKARQTHCANGHAFDHERNGSRRERVCRVCRSARGRRYRARKSAAVLAEGGGK